MPRVRRPRYVRAQSTYLSSSCRQRHRHRGGPCGAGGASRAHAASSLPAGGLSSVFCTNVCGLAGATTTISQRVPSKELSTSQRSRVKTSRACACAARNSWAGAPRTASSSRRPLANGFFSLPPPPVPPHPFSLTTRRQRRHRRRQRRRLRHRRRRPRGSRSAFRPRMQPAARQWCEPGRWSPCSIGSAVPVARPPDLWRRT